MHFAILFLVNPSFDPLARRRFPSVLSMSASENSDIQRVPDATKALDFLNLAGQLKGTLRTGWVYKGVDQAGQRVESVADHSWRMAAASFLFAGQPGYDVGKVVQMAVLHDMAEAITGDIAPADQVTPGEKKRRETEALTTMTSTLGGFSAAGAEAVQSLVHEYEARESLEAQAVKDLDLLEMIVQADEYERSTGLSLQDFFDSTSGKFKTQPVQAVVDALVSKRNMRRQKEQEEEDDGVTA